MRYKDGKELTLKLFRRRVPDALALLGPEQRLGTGDSSIVAVLRGSGGISPERTNTWTRL